MAKVVNALFTVDDDGEASGTVHCFCSQRCADDFKADQDAKIRWLHGIEHGHKFDWGMSEVPSDSEQCVECGQTIPQ